MIWKSIKDEKPLAYQTGVWDGKKSDKVLVCTRSGRYEVAELYEGNLDGTEYCVFYNGSDWEIENVVYWTEIDSPI